MPICYIDSCVLLFQCSGFVGTKRTKKVLLNDITTHVFLLKIYICSDKQNKVCNKYTGTSRYFSCAELDL